LILSNVQLNQSGAYSVFVSGDGGSALSSTATLTVTILPPIILTQPPASTLAATGSTVQLPVGVQGTPPFTYRWTRNGKPFATLATTLTLTNVQRANDGKYRVVVSNSAGAATSTDAQLKTLIPPIMFVSPQSKTATVGSKVVLRARAKGSPKLQYQWLFNGTPIGAAIKPQLVLKGVQAGQSGNYSVVVSNAVGTVTSAPAEIIVQ
jgi:hypothetical protein